MEGWTDMISGLAMMLLIAVTFIIGVMLFIWLWANKDEA
jgi:hypothetical protein